MGLDMARLVLNFASGLGEVSESAYKKARIRPCKRRKFGYCLTSWPRSEKTYFLPTRLFFKTAIRSMTLPSAGALPSSTSTLTIFFR